MGDYAVLNGVRLYHKLHGDATSKATPLVLIHGGIGGIEMFGPNLPALLFEKTAHMLEIWALFGGGQRDAGLDGSARPRAQLAVVPGTTRYNILANDYRRRLGATVSG